MAQITEDKAGTVWFGTRRGISGYSPSSGAWTTYRPKEGLAGNRVGAALVDATGAVWFAMNGDGVSRYDPRTGAWATFSSKDGLAHNNVHAIAQGRDGAILFGTNGGISRYDLKTGEWETLTTKDGLTNNEVHAIAIDAEGTIWAGTSSLDEGRYDSDRHRRMKFVSRIPHLEQWSEHATKVVVDLGGRVWVVTNGYDASLQWYDPKTKGRGRLVKPSGLEDSITDVAADKRGAIWVTTKTGNVGRYEPTTKSWKVFTKGGGLSAGRAAAVDPSGSVWVGGSTGDISRYDSNADTTTSITMMQDSLPEDGLRVIAAGGDGVLWVGTSWFGVKRISPSNTSEAGGVTALRLRQLLPGRIIHKTLLFACSNLAIFDVATSPTVMRSLPGGAEASVLAPGPNNSIWIGTTLSGLLLRKPDQDIQLTKESGLPSMNITALAPVPSDPTRIWVGTGGGAVLVRVNDQQAAVERVLSWEGMPTGPVDVLTLAEDGSVVVAYNALPANQFLDLKLAERRAKTHVFKIGPGGSPEEIPATEAFSKSEIRALAFSAKHGLWAGTSAGLFVAPRNEKHDGGTTNLDPAGFQPVTGQGRLTPAPIRRLVIAPDKDESIWMSIDKQGDTPPFLVGFRPGTGWVYNLTQERGVPEGDTIDDFGFTDDGDLIVLVGSKVVRGRAFVPATSLVPNGISPWTFVLLALTVASAGAGGVALARRRNSLAARIRRRPAALLEIPLAAVPAALQGLRRVRALDEVWTQLGLPAQNLRLVEPLASTKTIGIAELKRLAELLGMERADTATVSSHPHGIDVLQARLPYPAPLRDHAVALVSLQLSETSHADPARVRDTLASALQQAGHRFELPYLLLCGGDLSHEILPTNLAGLRIGEPERKTLIFARSPAHTLAGLLHTRGLLALSPYDTSGAVKEEQMFFGRVALLRELLLASSVQQIIVGPRRVGKTSLLQSLRRELPARRPDAEVMFLDLLGISDPVKAARSLARQLDIDLPRDADPETVLADLIRARYQGAGKKGVVLIDEADGLVEADAHKGFPLLGAMRTLQAEGTCTFVLAGYLYLYQQALNQHSPLYNFATLRILGPLEPEAARDLAFVPMQRLGIQYADPTLPTRIAARTGAYPSFVQLLCNALLKELKGGDLTVTATHVLQAERNTLVSGQLGDMFRLNAGKLTQIAVYGLLDQETFTRMDAEDALTRALGQAVPPGAIEQALLELRVFGFVLEQGGRFTWTIPLLRETLQASDPTHSAEQLVEEFRRKLPPGRDS